MSQNGGNGEQVEAATRTAVAATIVTSTALYLIYKKKLVRRNNYNGFPARFKRKCWKNKKLCISILLIIICIFMFFGNNGFSPSLPDFSNFGTNPIAGLRKQEEKHPNPYDDLVTKGPRDPYGYMVRENAIFYPQPRHRNVAW
ncbi:hypothetical protein KC19_3G216400 [Ceratodon purpureus]|uniref:Transmembrane protein n=1 Tax=Ceratodon purpureus TaxID=3225 RepID=A0A8T0ING1_CERPU|nr:hypothetical protein KC19_3G216400 [Ceratodon purpureus]